MVAFNALRGLQTFNRPSQHATLALIAALLLPSSGYATPLTPDHECMGRWVGRGRNTGYSTYWTIDLTLTAAPSGGRCGTIRYTNPDCWGFLDNCRLVGNDIHTQENYTHQGRCAPPGRVIIRCEQNQMRYSWIGWERVDTILSRPEGGPGGMPPSTPQTPGTSQPAQQPTPSPGQTAPMPPPPPMTPPSGGGTASTPAQPTPPTSSPSSGSSWFGCSVVAVEPDADAVALMCGLLLLCCVVARRRS